MSEVELYSTPPSRSDYEIKVQNQRDQPSDPRTDALSPAYKGGPFFQLGISLEKFLKKETRRRLLP